MSPTLEDIRAALPGGKIVRVEDGDAVRAPGPDHGPTDDSLLVRLDPSRECGFRVQSFAGDDQAAAEDFVRGKLGQGPWQPKAKGNGHDRNPVVATYVYENADGRPNLRVNRQAKPKKFFQEHPNGRGGWVNGGIPVEQLVPFKLPELVEGIALGKTVHVVEGEKAVQALEARGFTATCSPMGAEKWRDSYARWFQGAVVVVLPDNDPPGRRHAEQVAESLRSVAASVRIINLPGLPDGGDVVDWIAARNDPATIADLPDADLAESSGTAATPTRPARPEEPTEFTAYELQRMEIEPAKEIVPGLIAEGLTLLAGAPKRGKSWLALDLCCAVAGGRYVLDVECPAGGDVLFCGLEDGPRRLQRRMAKVMAAGGDWPKRLTYLTKLPKFDAGGEARLRAWIEQQDDPKLIVIDTLNYIRPARLRDEDWYAYDYRCATLIKRVADDYRIAILAIHHTRKSAADDYLESISGTNGLTGGSDAVMVLSTTKDGAVLQGRSRDLDDFEHAVKFDRQTCRWSMLGPAAEIRLSAGRKAILDALRSVNWPMTPKEIALQTGRPANNVSYLLGEMAKAGDVVRVDHGKYACARDDPPQNPQSPQDDG